jgi:hypothetical protein
MDYSVVSIESLAAEFCRNLSSRGFYKERLMHFAPCQSSGIMKTNRYVLGLVLLGELVIESSEGKYVVELGGEFYLKPNLHFQVSAAEHGAHFFYARQRNLNQ